MKRRMSRKLLLLLVLIFLFYSLVGWKIPIIYRMEMLKLPENCGTVFHTKIQISDVYWLHTIGEKVIKSDMGYEAAKAYIEDCNSEEALKYICIYPYEGMSDISLYDSQCDETFWMQSDRDNYITIRYFRKW